jgi:hypothetical protein
MSVCLLLLCSLSKPAHAWTPTRIGGRVAERGDASLIFVGRLPNGGVEFSYKNNLKNVGPSTWPMRLDLVGVLSSQPVTLVNSNGKVIVFGRGTDNRLYYRQETSPNVFAWWAVVEQGGVPGFVADPALVRLGDGRLAVFAASSDGAVYQSTQLTAGGAWSAYVGLGKPASTAFRTSPVIAINSNGALAVFLVGADQAVWVNQQTAAGGSWGGWASLGRYAQNTTDTLSVTYDPNGRLTVFVVNAGATVSFFRQTWANATTWTAWDNLPGGAHGFTRPAAFRNENGRFTVFFWSGGGGSTYFQSQTAPLASTWNGWTQYGYATSASPVGITDANGFIHVFLLDGSGVLHEAMQTSLNADTYTSWSAGNLGVVYKGL